MKRTGELALEGAHCASCAFTIEHLGRKIPGVEDVRVFAAEQKVRVVYEGSEQALDRLIDIVRKIGYDASVRSADAAE